MAAEPPPAGFLRTVTVELRPALQQVTPKPSALAQAAHVVPAGAFTNRPQIVQNAIQVAQNALQSAGIGINSAANGFWAAAGHLGTHTNDFFIELGQVLGQAQLTGTVAEALSSIRLNAIAGAFLR
jgi:hypothetical protein